MLYTDTHLSAGLPCSCVPAYQCRLHLCGPHQPHLCGPHQRTMECWPRSRQTYSCRKMYRHMSARGKPCYGNVAFCSRFCAPLHGQCTKSLDCTEYENRAFRRACWMAGMELPLVLRPSEARLSAPGSTALPFAVVSMTPAWPLRHRLVLCTGSGGAAAPGVLPPAAELGGLLSSSATWVVMSDGRARRRLKPTASSSAAFPCAAPALALARMCKLSVLCCWLAAECPGTAASAPKLALPGDDAAIMGDTSCACRPSADTWCVSAEGWARRAALRGVHPAPCLRMPGGACGTPHSASRSGTSASVLDSAAACAAAVPDTEYNLVGADRSASSCFALAILRTCTLGACWMPCDSITDRLGAQHGGAHDAKHPACAPIMVGPRLGRDLTAMSNLAFWEMARVCHFTATARAWQVSARTHTLLTQQSR